MTIAKTLFDVISKKQVEVSKFKTEVAYRKNRDPLFMPTNDQDIYLSTLETEIEQLQGLYSEQIKTLTQEQINEIEGIEVPQEAISDEYIDMGNNLTDEEKSELEKELEKRETNE